MQCNSFPVRMSSASIDIVLDRFDRTYTVGSIVTGNVVIRGIRGGFDHKGITLDIEGQFMLQLSAKSTGLFESFYSSLKPIVMIKESKDIAGEGRITDKELNDKHEKKFPFSFLLKHDPKSVERLYDTYHGVYISVRYAIAVDCTRGFMSKNLKHQVELVVVSPPGPRLPDAPFAFKLTEEQYKDNKKSKKLDIPKFSISGSVVSTNCELSSSFDGVVCIDDCEAAIKCIDLQLVRVESCKSDQGDALESSEIQALQIADGDVPRGIDIPIHMVLPRLFCCPSVTVSRFQLEFEMSVIVTFAEMDGQPGISVMQNFPIKLFR